MSQVRQLSAIMFADVMGFTALMQESEERAITIRDKFKNALERCVTNHRGRIVQFIGDGALCIFNSAIEAVRAAIEVQKQMSEEPRVPLRIGIHSGDVVMDQDNVYGDGVNIASRIESFAVPGGIFVSGKVYDEIRNQKGIETISLGKYELKNVKTPVEIFAISNPGLEVPSQKKLEGKGKAVSIKRNSLRKILFPLAAGLLLLMIAFILYKNFLHQSEFSGTDRSIAVLPFQNLSDNKDDEYFTEGMTDEILASLSKMNGLKVFSRTSTVQYKNTTKTMKQIGAELSVQTLVEGSVRKVGDQLRVIVQLINAKTDEHIWAETYNRAIKDVFAIQSEVAQQIAEELDNKLTDREKKLIEEKPTSNMQAYDFYLRGNNYTNLFWNDLDMNEQATAVGLYRAAIHLDPNFIEPYAAIISLYTKFAWLKVTADSYIFLPKAKALLDTMLALNIDKPIVHYTLGSFKYAGERDYEGALTEYDKLLKDDPNNSDVIWSKAFVQRRLGRWDDAIENLHKVADRNPNVASVFYDLAETYTMNRDADNALINFDKAISLAREKTQYYSEKALMYVALQGDWKKAREVLHASSAFVNPDLLTDMYNYFNLLEGNYSDPLKNYLRYPDSIMFTQGNVYLNAQYIAIIYRIQGNNKQAKKYFAKERDLLTARLQITPDDFRLYSALGIAYAGLGQRQEALANGNRARAMMPLSRDALIGINPLEDLACIHTLLGDQEDAINILEQLLKLPLGLDASNSIPLLKAHPYWIPLHENPRFKKLVGKGD